MHNVKSEFKGSLYNVICRNRRTLNSLYASDYKSLRNEYTIIKNMLMFEVQTELLISDLFYLGIWNTIINCDQE